MAVPATSLPDEEPLVILPRRADVDALRPVASTLARPVSPTLLLRLMTYQRGRLAAGVAGPLLAAAGVAVPAFIDLCKPGWSPATHAQALAPQEVEALAGVDLADCLTLAAEDGRGQIVDILRWRLGDQPVFLGGLQPEPAGVLTPRVAAVGGTVGVVDDLAAHVRRLAGGERHVVLLRADMPIASQLRLYHAQGLRRIQAEVRDRAALAAAAADLGIVCEEPTAGSAPWSDPVVDRGLRRATWTSGTLVVTAEVPVSASSSVQVEVRQSDGRRQGGVCDLAVPRQINDFIALAARKTGAAADHLGALLNAALLDRLRALAADSGTPVPAISAATPADAADTDPGADALASFEADTDALGWVGDSAVKRIGVLSLASLGLPQPSWLIVRGPLPLAQPMVGLLHQFLPPDRCLHLTGATERSLLHHGVDGLRHRQAVIDDAARLRRDTVTALRVLQARGAIAMPVSTRDSQTGRMASRLVEASGPLGLIAAAAGTSVLDDLAVVVRLDEAAEQTARAMAAARQRLVTGSDAAVARRVQARWSGILAALPPLPVRIPDAERVVFPARHPRHRGEQDRFFSLVAAHARLHHKRRPQADGCIIATPADIAAVIAATRGILGRVDDGLSDRARHLVGLLAGRKDQTITVPDLTDGCPAWSRDEARGALDELLRAGRVTSPTGGRGRRARRYTLVGDDAAAQPGIRLLAPNEPLPVLGTPHIGSPNITTAQKAG